MSVCYIEHMPYLSYNYNDQEVDQDHSQISLNKLMSNAMLKYQDVGWDSASTC